MNNIYLKYKTRQQPARTSIYSSQPSLVSNPEPSTSVVTNGFKVTSYQPKKPEQEMEEEVEKIFPKSQDNFPSYKVTELKFSTFNLPKIGKHFYLFSKSLLRIIFPRQSTKKSHKKTASADRKNCCGSTN